MTVVAWDFSRCVSVFNREIALLKAISAAQKRVREAVLNREWADFDTRTEEVNRLGGEFTRLEEERLALFTALGGNSSGPEERPFYVLIGELPLEESRELSRLYRDIKTETLMMKAMNEAFLAYVDDARTMASAYLEAVCPARSGKLYTRKGQKVSQDLRSIVFNNRF